MSIFTQGKALANAKQANESGNLDSFLAPLVAAGLFESGTKAREAFDSAVKAEAAAALGSERAKAAKAAQEILDGFTIPKSLCNLLGSVVETASVPDSDGNVNAMYIRLWVDPNDGKPSLKLSSGASGATTKGRAPRGKVLLNGQPCTKAYIVANYPDSLAAKVLNANGCPYGLVKRANGTDYSETTRWAAAEAARNDPELKGLLTKAE